MRYFYSCASFKVIEAGRALCMMLWVLFLAALIGGTVSAAPIIQYQTTNLGVDASGDTVIGFSFTLSGLNLLANDEFDIQFPVTAFTQLSNGVAGAGFDLLLFQPNQPVGVQGDYSALALVDNPSLSGTFTVDATLASGITVPPSSLPFVIYNDNVTPSAVLFEGNATAAVSAVPEPSDMLLCGSGMIVAAAAELIRRRRRKQLDRTSV